MNVIQSYFTTVMKGNFSLYEVRIFIKIVEQANQVIKGSKGSDLLGRAFCTDGINANLSIPIKTLLTENSNDYTLVKKALISLSKKKIEMYDPVAKEWRYTPFISNIRKADGDGLVKFVVAKWLLNYIVDFMYCNFSAYNLAAALALPSAYAVRLYWLTCSMGSELDYTITMLRDMLGTGDHYPRNKDFIKRCIAPAERILKERDLNGFTFTKIVEKGKITKIHFVPVKREKTNYQVLQEEIANDQWCHPALRAYLTSQCGFTMRELKNNADTLKKFSSIDGWQDIITKIARRARKQRAGKGYYIKAIKSECIERGHRNLAAEVTEKMRQAGLINAV